MRKSSVIQNSATAAKTTTMTRTRSASVSLRSKIIRSKYFSNVDKKNRKSKNKNKCKYKYSENNDIIGTSRSTSDYFLHSSSSAYGSVVSLGPLVYTWIGRRRSREEIRSKCCRMKKRYKKNYCNSSSLPSSWKLTQPCPYCESILSEVAFRHFKACPVFQNEQCLYNTGAGAGASTNECLKYKASNGSSSTFISTDAPTGTDTGIPIPCVEIFGQWAEQYSLRHLCPNQCFLRAFAPSRDWMILRKKIEQYMPIGEVLDDWTCHLVFNEIGNDIDTCSKIEKESPGAQPKSVSVSTTISNHTRKRQLRQTNSKAINSRTEFISLLSGKTFSSFEKGRKLLFCNSRGNNKGIFVKKNYSLSPSTTMIGRNQLIDNTGSADSVYSSTRSPFGLLEEILSDHPWRLLVSTMLLNKTKRNQNIDRIIHQLFQRWPVAESVVHDANNDEDAVRDYVFAMVRDSGFGRNKSKAFVRLSRDYLSLVQSKKQTIGMHVPSCEAAPFTGKSVRYYSDPAEFHFTREEIKNLYNCGDYAADAFQIFIRKDLNLPLVSNDYMLRTYVDWQKSVIKSEC